MFGYYKELTFVLSKKMSIIKKKQFSQSLYLLHSQSTIDDHDIERLLKFRFNFVCTEAIFDRTKINSHGAYFNQE